MAEPSGEAGDDVLPPLVNQLLGLSWILLFAGRWVVVQLLLAAGVLSSALVADLDARALLRIYLVLLAVTIMVAALRVMRESRLKAANRLQPASDISSGSERADTVSLEAAHRRPKPGD